MANDNQTTVKTEETYAFPNLETMERAVKAAVGALESDLVAFAPNHKVIFFPVGSLLFDENIRAEFKKFGTLCAAESVAESVTSTR